MAFLPRNLFLDVILLSGLCLITIAVKTVGKFSKELVIGKTPISIRTLSTAMPTTEHFKCVTCEFSFDSPAGLSQHVAVAHHECSVCGDTFENTENLDEHTQNDH